MAKPDAVSNGEGDPGSLFPNFRKFTKTRRPPNRIRIDLTRDAAVIPHKAGAGKRIALSTVMSRVLLAGDNPTSLAALLDLFEAHREFLLCGQVQTREETIAKAARLKPGLIILDFADQSGEIFHTAKELREKLPNAQLFLLTEDYDFYMEKAAVLCGVDAVFAKDEGLGPLLSNAQAACGLEIPER